MDNTITITPSGIAIGSPLVAGTQLSVTATGMEVAEDATLFLIVTSRFPDLLVASCPLSETTTDGEYAGTLYTATKQMALFLVNARADEARSASIELVDTAHGASLARTTVPIYNSSLIPQPCRWPSASPLYVPGPAASVLVGTTTTLPPGSPATVENVGTTSDAVLNFGIPKGEHGDTKTPSDTPPLMDGAASAGTSDEYARGDHRHPTDTSRASVSDLVSVENGLGRQIDALDTSKQDTIPDLAAIRSGAAAGATAVQPASLSDYRTATAQDAIDNTQTKRIGLVEQSVQGALNGVDALDRAVQTIGGMIPSTASSSNKFATAADLSGKQAVISDLATIRSGAAAGATAVQPGDMDEFLYFDPTTDIIKRVGNHQDVVNIYLTGGTYGGGYAVNLPELDMGVRYAFAAQAPSVSGTSATVACEDRAINDFTVATGITSLTITPPAAVTGRARDFFCRVTLTDSSLPTVTLSGGTIDIGSTEVAGMTQGVNLLMFTEIASGHWLASRRSAS